MCILDFISISSVEIYAHIINVLFLLVVPDYYSIIFIQYKIAIVAFDF
jgi:hypothetical protein